MADTTSLEERVKSAERSLNSAFGIPTEEEGQGANRFLDLESLAAAYKEEISNKEITQQFITISKAVRNMRSSFLPINFFIGEDGRFNADLADTVADHESYENAFMRMLGMPSVGLAEFGLSREDSEIRSSESLKIVDPITGIPSEVSFEEVKTLILDERQKERSVRKVKINNKIFDVFTSVQEASAVSAEVVGSLEQIEDPLEEISASIDTIESDLWKFSYLLLPPIQSVEIAQHINEPDKIVAAPFSNSRTRRINDTEIRPTLLESIIRIRLDKVSGTDTFVDTSEENDPDFSIDINLGGEEEEIPVISDDYGILEALFILRLRSAISGLAQKLYSDIDIIINEMSKSQRLPVDESPNTGEIENAPSIEAANQLKDIKSFTAQDAITETKINSLQQQKLIEDSILFLLGDQSDKGLDLQLQTQRKTSIHNSHMMSGLIGIIDVPNKRITRELNELIISRNESASTSVEQKVQEIGTTLGTDIGIGTIDLAVFSLALFTLSERSLLGLLSTAQFERIKNGEFKALLPDEGDKEDTVVALNELSQLIIEGYNIFISELKNDINPNL